MKILIILLLLALPVAAEDIQLIDCYHCSSAAEAGVFAAVLAPARRGTYHHVIRHQHPLTGKLKTAIIKTVKREDKKYITQARLRAHIYVMEDTASETIRFTRSQSHLNYAASSFPVMTGWSIRIEEDVVNERQQ